MIKNGKMLIITFIVLLFISAAGACGIEKPLQNSTADSVDELALQKEALKLVSENTSDRPVDSALKFAKTETRDQKDWWVIELFKPGMGDAAPVNIGWYYVSKADKSLFWLDTEKNQLIPLSEFQGLDTDKKSQTSTAATTLSELEKEEIVSPDRVTNEDEAINKLAAALGEIPAGYAFMMDREEVKDTKSFYVIRLFENVGSEETGDAHISTVGWYYVEKGPGTIYEYDVVLDSLKEFKK